MSKRTLALWLVFIAVMLITGSTADMSSTTKEKIKAGIAVGEKGLEFIEALGDKGENTEKVFKALGKMASFLGAAGGLISLALLFVPQQDSVELKYMKEKFSEVNGKLDIITIELDNVKNLITYENQRSVYLDAANDIIVGHKRLNEFLDEITKTPCSGKDDCKRKRARISSRYVDHFNIRDQTFKILHGAMSKTGAYGDPFLDVAKKTFKCDVGKVDRISASILKLAFKAQQVILAHEKLTGSKISIVQSMEDWLKSIYDLRDKTNAVKQSCYDNIKAYMLKDIKDNKYQVGVSSNGDANNKLKNFLDAKYPWLGWVTYSYGVYESSTHAHYVQNQYGEFWNIPKNKNDRKRNLIATFTDKSGKYMKQKYKVLNAIDLILASKKTNFFKGRWNARKLLPLVEKELRKKSVWKYVTSLNVQMKYEKNGFVYNKDINEESLIHEEYTLISFTPGIPEYKKRNRNYWYDKVRLVIVLKSEELADGVTCSKTCNSHGTCHLLPYSSVQFCNCKAYYQGTDCEENSEAQLAETMDGMLKTTLKLPLLSDISYDIQDLREYLGVSIGSVQQSVSQLTADMKKSFDKLSRTLGNKFQWTSLVVSYRTAIQKIEYFVKRFKNLPKHYTGKNLIAEGKKLSTAVLAAEGIQKWLHEVNFLFQGRSGVALVKHAPLMFVFMDKYEKKACSKSYKAAVDNAWKKLVLLQQMGYMLWAQARDLLGEETKTVGERYKTTTGEQVAAFKEKTCQYSVPHSTNIQCTGGNYIHKDTKLTNKCEANYYVKGAKETTCVSKASSCAACSCFTSGSTRSECADLTGQCYCRLGFEGKRCENRNCVWSAWSSYSQCSKNCDYGGSKDRNRYHELIKYGNGNTCSGRSSQTDSCFKGCCSNQFHCSKQKKCITSSYKCNYDNDCGDKQDEENCQESCTSKTTDWNSAGGGNAVYMAKHTLNCGGNGHVLKMFRLERNSNYGSKIRFAYTCCRLNKVVCSNKADYTLFSNDGDGDARYLDRHAVDCGKGGYLNYFKLRRNNDRDKVSYKMFCCNLSEQKHRERTICYTSYTGYTGDGGGNSFYLDRQTVRCRDKFFLSYFRLRRRSSTWRYEYRCCRIQP